MTKPEQRELGELSTMFKGFIENFNDFKANTKESHEILHKKIDDGQKADKERFDKIDSVIYDVKGGVLVRLDSVEKTRTNIKNGIGWLGGSGVIGGVGVFFKDKILSLFHI